MRDVVIIGGGLSGLAACYELEKRGAAYTVIEVKRRFGGGIRSAREKGFIMDAGAFAFQPFADDSPLESLGLHDQVFDIDAETCAFSDGTESLIQAVADRLTGGRLMRMAVSSIGRLGNRFTLCLENGLMLDAGAVILAAPACYAARMLYNLAPEAAERLAEYRCENIWHVALGIHQRDLRLDLPAAEFAFMRATDHPARVPDRDCRLIQLGLKAPATAPPSAIIRRACDCLGFSAAPIAACAAPSAEALSIYDHDHAANMRRIRALLPAGLSLIGSDYLLAPPAQPGLAQLEERMARGRAAAQTADRFLNRRRST